MKFKEFLTNFSVGIKDGVSRFLIAFICTTLTFLTISYEIIFETDSFEIIVPLCMAFTLAAVLSVLLKTLQEYMCEKLGRIIQCILCAVTGVVGYVLIHMNYESLYMIMSYTGVMIALICFIFFVVMSGENRDRAFPKLVTSYVFSQAICSVLSAGLSICISAVQTLIFSWDSYGKFLLIVNSFVWVVAFINIFLSFIPKKDADIPTSKIFRVFVLFAGLPVYTLLIAILLVYLAKIVVTWRMPVGEINWFASFASLFFIFFLLSVKQYKEKTAKLFVKYGGYFLAPVLIIQAIAVFERINAYGLTTPRTVSLVLIIISIIFILGSVITPKHLNKIALISGVIVLIVTVTPLNVIDMPIKSQTRILENVLTANNMLVDGKVVPNSDISDEDKEKIVSSYEYLKYDAKNTPDFIPNADLSFPQIFGFTTDYGYNQLNYISCQFVTKNPVDITAFDKLLEIHDDNDVIKLEHNGQKYTIDLKQIAGTLYDEYGADEAVIELYPINENISLYFKRFSFEVENDEIKYCYFNGYALIKN